MNTDRYALAAALRPMRRLAQLALDVSYSPFLGTDGAMVPRRTFPLSPGHHRAVLPEERAEAHVCVKARAERLRGDCI